MYEYSALYAKIKAMYGKRLCENDYNELIRKKSVGEIAAYLKALPRYQDALSDVTPSTVHRRDLERRLKNVIFTEYFKISKFVFHNAKGIFNTLMTRYEIEVLKNMLWLLDDGKNADFEYYLNLPDFLEQDATLNLQALAVSRNYHQFIQGLQGTKYEKPLQKFLNISHQIENFDIEMALDQYYFSQILGTRNKVGKSDKKVLDYLIASDVDLVNMLMIYRSKFYYQLSKETVFNLVVPFYNKLNPDIVTKLVESRDTASFLQTARQTAYAQVFESDDGKDMDLQYKKYIYRLNQKQLHKTESNIGVVISYLVILEVEIRNIISIIEGIRYSLDPEQIREYVLI